MEFSAIRNSHEASVLAAVQAAAARYPAVASDGEVLADVACVALNRLTPCYARQGVGPGAPTTERERAVLQRELGESVDFAFGYVQARRAMAARR